MLDRHLLQVGVLGLLCGGVRGLVPPTTTTLATSARSSPPLHALRSDAAPVSTLAVAAAFAAAQTHVAAASATEGASVLLADFGVVGGVNFFRDPIDAYYALVLLGGVGFWFSTTSQKAVEEIKEADRRGPLANKMAAEAKRRERAGRLQAVKAEDPAYDRLQQEAKERARKREGWKIFPGWKGLPGEEES